MMNKKGLSVIGFGIYIVLGIGFYLIYSAIEGWLSRTLNISNEFSFFLGIIIVFIVLFFLRKKLPFRP